MKTDSFFPAFSSRLFRKWFGILDHALYVFKAFRTQFDCHAIFVGNIERKFDAGVYGLFIAESRIVSLCPSKTTEPYPSSVARLCASRIKADPIPRF